MKLTLRPWGEALLDVLFPPQCAACRAIGREPFCRACEASVDVAPRVDVAGLDAAEAVWAYGGAVAQAVSRFKYEGRVELARPLSRALAAQVDNHRPDLLVPIPLSAARLRSRGFNQARELTRSLRQQTVTKALRRKAGGSTQVGRTRSERWVSLRGMFVAERILVADRKIVLIDDVVTTGATARAAAKALRDAGARWVGLVVVAATPHGTTDL